MEEYKERMRLLNKAAYAAVGVCPHKYPHPTFKALVKIAHEIDDLIDYETWGRDNMPHSFFIFFQFLSP